MAFEVKIYGKIGLLFNSVEGINFFSEWKLGLQIKLGSFVSTVRMYWTLKK